VPELELVRSIEHVAAQDRIRDSLDTAATAIQSTLSTVFGYYLCGFCLRFEFNYLDRQVRSSTLSALGFIFLRDCGALLDRRLCPILRYQRNFWRPIRSTQRRVYLRTLPVGAVSESECPLSVRWIARAARQLEVDSR
jgi:hypothetical protein